MTDDEKVEFYDFHKLSIHPVIKSDRNTKPLWRKLFWTTARDSKQYKSGCIDILKTHFPNLFNKLYSDKYNA